MFPRMRLLFPQRHISLLHLKEKIVLSNKKHPPGIADTFAYLIAGSISSLHGNEIIKSSIQAALPFLSMPIPLYRISKIHSENASPVSFIHGKTNPIHPSYGRESPETPSIEKTLLLFPRHFHNFDA